MGTKNTQIGTDSGTFGTASHEPIVAPEIGRSTHLLYADFSSKISSTNPQSRLRNGLKTGKMLRKKNVENGRNQLVAEACVPNRNWISFDDW